jgi:hypothetical protein
MGLVSGYVDAMLAQLTVDDPLLRARLIVCGADSYREAERLAPERREAWKQAWTELQRVDARDAGWQETALLVTAIADYPAYRSLTDAKLADTHEGFWRARALEEAFPIAARERDWATFERWVTSYRELPSSLRSDHNEGVVRNIEGVRALDEGRIDDARRCFEELLAVAPRIEFLSNPETSMLCDRLRADGLFPELCDQFEAIVKDRDWRLLRKS